MCPNYRFKSITEQKRHVGMFHRRRKSQLKVARFDCVVCQKQITSLASLNRHKVKKGHNARKNAALDEPAKKWRKTKQRTINDMLRQNQGCAGNDAESDSDEEIPCPAASCKINSLDNVVINWIGCESCDCDYNTLAISAKDI